MNSPKRIAVIGAGLIGRGHVARVARMAQLDAVIDPDPASERIAADHGAPWFGDLDQYLAGASPDGAILATPNQLHATQGLALVEAGVPALIEKPIADTAQGAERLVARASSRGVPLLIGHHRRHNPKIAAARQAILDGKLGDIVAVTAQFWLMKPADYFAPPWRRAAGAGPIFINLIHDIDLLRHLCGEVRRVQAVQSSAARGFAVEDTAAVLLEFQNGALGTISVSDTVAAPWSWEFTADENPAYPHVRTHAYAIGGTKGSLSVPDLTLWAHPGAQSWWAPIEGTSLPVEHADPLDRQFAHFLDVIDGAPPLVSGAEGLATLRLLEAIKTAAETGCAQELQGFSDGGET